MRHLESFILLLSFSALVASCSDVENEGGASGRTSLSINAAIGSRAADNAWQAGDAIGVMMLEAGSAVPAQGGTNYKYVTAAGDGTFAAADKENTAWYPKDGSEVDVVAYYPYMGGMDATSLSVAVNVKQQDNLPAIDLMTCGRVAGLSSKKPDAKLAFRHRLSKLVVKVKVDKALGDLSLEGAGAVLSGTPVTATWNLLEDKLAGVGEATDISLPLSASGTVATAIVLPVAATGKSIAVKLADGTSFVAAIGDELAFQSGTVNTCTMTLRPHAADISVSVAPWSDGVDAEMRAVSLDIPSYSVASEVTSLTLVKITEGEDTPAEVSYEYSGGEWTASPEPYYVEDILPTDRFYAYTSSGEKDEATGLTDCLGTEWASLTDNALSLNFKHLLTQLKVNVKSEDATLELAGATVATPSLISSFKLGVNDKGACVVPGSDKKVYEGLAVGSSCLMVPQDASGDYVVTLEDGSTFSTVVSGFTLAAGKLNTLTLTLVPYSPGGDVTVGDVTVSAWETGEVVDIAPGTISGITESGVLEVMDMGSKVSGFYPIIYADGKAGFGTITSPLKWSEDPFDVTYWASFNPDAEVAVGSNQQKDYLIGAVECPWGTPPAFKLYHKMGRITVTLTSSDGTYDGQALKEAVLTTQRSCKYILEGSQIEKVTSEESTVTFTNNDNGTYTATLYPQTLSELTLTISGKTYILKQEMKLIDRKVYKLSADIGHTVNVSAVTVVDWGEIDGGDGTFTEDNTID